MLGAVCKRPATAVVQARLRYANGGRAAACECTRELLGTDEGFVECAVDVLHEAETVGLIGEEIAPGEADLAHPLPQPPTPVSYTQPTLPTKKKG
eukprot:NODE_24555_length_620_cov_2.829615.p3 GENE.NODE_24555_length_620_cov_2.829615~~NODE_24555_length_620_cov_2.829615.p3  ORF type:complete len:95 (-),score=20.16 NODE_24555_length_620_cov_2.829615:32-316(-)